MSSALDITKAVSPPRAAFLDYPLGHTTGKPHNPILQYEILIQALDAFNIITQPGSYIALDFSWSESSEWKNSPMHGDMRTPRYDTPQYQSEEDRILAEASNPSMRMKA